MKLVYWCFLISVALKPFYIFKSGSLQPGDLFLIIAFALFLYSKKRTLEVNINKIDKLLIYFILCVTVINSFYSIYHYRIDFTVSTLFYIFNFIVIFLFRYFIKDKYFLEMLFKICKLNLWIQLLIYLTGLGEYYEEVRYIGSFNDPNQLAFFVYITLMVMFLTSKILEVKVNLIYYLIVLFLIFQAASTGMLLAMGTFILLLFIFKIESLIKFKIKVRTIMTFSFISIILVMLTSVNMDNITKFSEESFLIHRAEEKIMKISNSNMVNSNSYEKFTLIEERGIDKLLLYPERVLIGSGQGYYQRFDEAAHNGEIHSTLPSMLFYYGIIPFILIIAWFLKNIKSVSRVTLLVFLPLFIESFTLLNQRQPLFWMLFILAFLYSTNREKKNVLKKEF